MEVENISENRKKCICPHCPSYPKNCSGEVLYCSQKIGHSACDINAQGCVCPGCPVYAEYKLDKLYFCDKEKVSESGVTMRKIRTGENKAFYQNIVAIKDLAATGKSLIRSMGSRKIMPFSLDDFHFLPAQVAKIPLNREEKVNTKIILGSVAKRPLELNSPIMLSGVSFGATSKKVKLVLAEVSRKMAVAYNSGEGGILPEELKKPHPYLIGQYATGRFGFSEDIFKKLAAVEIRFGQGAYPGKGSYLPAGKMTEEVARIRGLKKGEAAYSPAHHSDMKTSEEIKRKIDWLKKLTNGAPIGAKIGCGHIEKDVEVLVKAGVDFIALDGFGGGTGATEIYIRDNVGLPIWAAVPCARRKLEALGVKNRITLIAGGGLRSSADFAKCLALGADAVYIGTAALIAIGCEQYRICHTGLCPTGVTTHNPQLTAQIDVKKGAERLMNFLKISTEEIANLVRVVGKNDVSQLSQDDLVALGKDPAELTGVSWLKG